MVYCRLFQNNTPHFTHLQVQRSGTTIGSRLVLVVERQYPADLDPASSCGGFGRIAHEPDVGGTPRAGDGDTDPAIAVNRQFLIPMIPSSIVTAVNSLRMASSVFDWTCGLGDGSTTRGVAPPRTYPNGMPTATALRASAPWLGSWLRAAGPMAIGKDPLTEPGRQSCRNDQRPRDKPGGVDAWS